MATAHPSLAWELQDRSGMAGHEHDSITPMPPNTIPAPRQGSSLEISHDWMLSHDTRNNEDVHPGQHKEQGISWSTHTSTTTIGVREGHDPSTPQWPFQEPEGTAQSQPSRNLPSHTPPKASRPGHTRHVLRYWLLEILTVLTAALLLAAVIALLSYYDGKYMPQWPLELNLTSVIALLTTFLRSAIVAAVAEIIGQIKWTWFTERTRPLHHLQDFDAASRSVLGSLRLLAVVMWNVGFTTAGLIGISAAVVTIASLAVSPFTQQALKTSNCPQLNPALRAAMPVANFVPGSSAYFRTGAGQFQIEVDMKSTLIQGITDPRNKDNQVEVTCSSGNCTWPDYGTGVTHASMGMCSMCMDTTDFVSEPTELGNLTLPDEGSFINYMPGGNYMWIGNSNLSAYTSLFDEGMLAAAAVSIANFSMLLTTTAPCTSTTDPSTGIPSRTCPHKVTQSNNTFFAGIGDYVATSCILYPCMQEYRATYTNNILKEDVVKTVPAIPNVAETSGYVYAYNYTATQSPCVLDNGTWYDYANQSRAEKIPGRTWANISASDVLKGGTRNYSVPNACLYKMDGIYFQALSSFMRELFSGSCTYDDLQSGHLNCRESWWLPPLWGEMNATYASLNTAINDFSWAVTNKFRMTGAGPDDLLGEPLRRSETVGAVYETSTCISFDRKWVSLPVILVFICAVLLFAIAVKNYRDPEQPVWKGSVLPLLFFGLHAAGENNNSNAASRPTTISQASHLSVGEKGMLNRRSTFFRENGRAAPELDRIQDEAGKMWVRFHGGTDPGFVDLGVVGRKNRGGDVEGSSIALVPGSSQGTRPS